MLSEWGFCDSYANDMLKTTKKAVRIGLGYGGRPRSFGVRFHATACCASRWCDERGVFNGRVA